MAQPSAALDVQAIPDNPINHDNEDPAVINVRPATRLGEHRISGLEHLAFSTGQSIQSVADFSSQIRQNLADRYHDAAGASRDFFFWVNKRAKQTKEDHPLELLAAIAGTAFVLGMLARVLGSRDNT
ncbi:MAG TPA: hypothetical protein VLK33_17420 [Terriglobales bacterium]|nr:hypothetical protein [Terriglobales bacterium]